MRDVLLVAGKDLRLRARDRSLFLFALVAPFVLAVVLGLVFGDVEGSLDVDVAHAVDTTDPAAAALVEEVLPAVAADGPVDVVVALEDADAVVAAVDDGTVDVGLVTAPDGVLEVVTSPGSPTAGSIMVGLVRSTVTETRAATDLVELLRTTDPAAVTSALEAFTASGRGRPVSVEQTGVGPLDLTTYVAAGISVFFLFFAVGLVVTGLLEEERDGTMQRLRTAPIAGWVPLVAKAVAAMAVGVVSMLLLAAATTVVLDADWGDPVALVLLVGCAVVAATGVVGLVAALARTPESASAAQAVVGTVLGALGGSFFPITATGLLGVVTLATPHRWFLDGLESVAGGDPGGAAVPAAVLLGMGVVSGAVALRATARRAA